MSEAFRMYNCVSQFFFELLHAKQTTTKVNYPRMTG